MREHDPQNLTGPVWDRLDPDGSRRAEVAALDALRRVPVVGRWLLDRAGVDPEELDQVLSEPDRLVGGIARSISAFAGLGWAYSVFAPMDAYEQALHLLDEGDADEAEEVLVEAWERGFETFLMRVPRLGTGSERMRRIVHHRAILIDKALAHHENGAYDASIPIVLAQIDGLCLDFTGKDFFNDPRRHSLADDQTVAGLPENLDVARKWFSKPQRSSVISGQLSRHGVMHGRELGYDTRKNSVRAFVLLLAVIEWAEARLMRGNGDDGRRA